MRIPCERTSRIAMMLCLLAAVSPGHGCKKKNAPPAPASDATGAAPGRTTAEDASLAEKAERTFAAIEGAWAKTQSFSAKINTYLAEAIGRAGRTEGSGTYDLLKDGEKLKIRFYVENALYITVPEEELTDIRTAEFLYWVTDGTYLYQSTHQHKLYEVTKTWYREENVLQLAGPRLMHTLRDERTVLRIEDVQLQDRKCFAISTQRPGSNRLEHYYFDKETGIRIKYVEFDENRQRFFDLTLSDLKTGVEFEPDHFTLEVPEAATFIDKTKE